MKKNPLKLLLTAIMLCFWFSCEKPEVVNENPIEYEFKTDIPLNAIGGAVRFVSIQTGEVNFDQVAEYYAANFDLDFYGTVNEWMKDERIATILKIVEESNLRTTDETPEVNLSGAIEIIGLSPKGLEYLDELNQIGPDDSQDSLEVEVDLMAIGDELVAFENKVLNETDLTEQDKELLYGLIDTYTENYEEIFTIIAEAGSFDDDGRVMGLKKLWRKVRSVVITTAVVMVATAVVIASGGTAIPFVAALVSAPTIILGSVVAVATTADFVINDRCWYALSCAQGWCQKCSTGECLVCNGSNDYSTGGYTGGYQDYNIPAEYDCQPGGSCKTIQLDPQCSDGGRCDDQGDITQIQLDYLKKYGAREFAELAESVLTDFNLNPSGITVGDYWEVQLVIQQQYLALKGRYLMLITRSFAEVAKPIVEIALANIVTEVAINRIQVVIAWRMAQAAKKVSGSLTAFEHASKYGIKSIAELRKAVPTGSGLQKHHLLEQRFASKLGVHPDNMLGIVLTEAEHRIFTLAWRAKIGYDGTKAAVTTSTATQAQVRQAAKEIYSSYPEILKALGL